MPDQVPVYESAMPEPDVPQFYEAVGYMPGHGDDPTVYDEAQDHVPDGSVAEVLGWVGDDPHRAVVALAAERERDSQRATLVGPLEALVAEGRESGELT